MTFGVVKVADLSPDPAGVVVSCSDGVAGKPRGLEKKVKTITVESARFFKKVGEVVKRLFRVCENVEEISEF